MKIIYQTPNGIAVVTPSGELSDIETARKDVPAGVAYRIIGDDEKPEATDFTVPDGIGADYGVGSQWDVVGYTESGEPMVRHTETGETKLIAVAA
jgi:hypothetical protein